MSKTTFYLLLLFFLPAVGTPISSPTIPSSQGIEYQNTITVTYQQQTLYIQGLIGQGLVEVFSIIGNKVAQFQVVDLSNAKIPISLESGNMYIVRVRYQGNVMKTFKILAS